MSPFLSGALGAAAILLVAGLLRRARFHRRSFRSGRSASWFLRRLFRRLGTRPEQERVVSAEADALAAELRRFREEAVLLRGEVAELWKAPELDLEAVSRALDARLSRLAAVKARLAEALARTHAVLDPEQRQALASLIARGPGRCHRIGAGPAGA